MGSEGIEIVDFYEAVSTASPAHEILTVGCERDGTSHQGRVTADYCISELIPARSIPIVYLDQPGARPIPRCTDRYAATVSAQRYRLTSVVIVCGRGKTGNIRTHKQVIVPVPFIDTDVTCTLCLRGESTTVIVYRDRATEISI